MGLSSTSLHVCALLLSLSCASKRAAGSRSADLADTALEAIARFFCSQRGCTREEALSPDGPVAALLVGARAHAPHPRPLLLARLTGVAPHPAGSDAYKQPAAWQFLRRLLGCLRELLGPAWPPLAKVRPAARSAAVQGGGPARQPTGDAAPWPRSQLCAPRCPGPRSGRAPKAGCCPWRL